MEWFAVLIPIIGVGLTYYMFPHKVAWFEIFMPIVPAIIIIPTVKLSTETLITSDKERWGSYVVSSRYFEKWDEYIHRTCSTTDSKGHTTYYDCSYVDTHYPYWEVTDSLGVTYNVDEETYLYIKERFGNNTFHDMHRHYHSIDGDMYETEYHHNKHTMVYWFTIHNYENRVQAARSVFKYPKITDSNKLYDWPKLENNMYDPAILGDAPSKDIADKILQQYNAIHGRDKQVRVWILLFKNEPRSIAFDQESYWDGGNKNEVTICIGTDDNYNIKWCNCFCWSPDGNTSNDTMKINIRDYVEKQKSLQGNKLVDIVEYSCKQINELFQRKHFKEFSYLTVDMPIGATIACYVITVLVTIGVCWIVVANDVDSNNESLADIVDSFRS